MNLSELTSNNPNVHNAFVNFYEQIFLNKRNLTTFQAQQQQQQPQPSSLNLPLTNSIINNSSSSNSPTNNSSQNELITSHLNSSNPSLIGIKSNDDSASISSSSTEPEQQHQQQQNSASSMSNNLELNNAYMQFNAAAAAAAAMVFSQFNNPLLIANPKSVQADNTIKTQAEFEPLSPAVSPVNANSPGKNSASAGVGSSGEEPKPTHSYIGLIALAILSTPERKLVLSDIYQWILDNYTYFHNRGSGWRNSIRHNLSLNDCFMKAGRSSNGKGHYWTIHPANLEDFMRGDFRRRRAQRRVRKSLGLTVPEEDEEDEEEDALLLPAPASFLNAAAAKFNPFSSPMINFVQPNQPSQHPSFSLMNPSVNNPVLNNNLSYYLQSRANYSNFFNQFQQNMIPNNHPFLMHNNQSNLNMHPLPGFQPLYLSASYQTSQKRTAKSFKEEENDEDDDEIDLENVDELVSETTEEEGEIKQTKKKNSGIVKRSFNVDSLLASESSKKMKTAKETNINSGKNKKEKNAAVLVLPAASSSSSSSSSTCSSLNDSIQSLNDQNNQEKDLNNNHNSNRSLKNTFQKQENCNSPFSKLESDNQDVEKWKQTFSKIMARSYKNNNNSPTIAGKK
jgi:hypothetical protein